MNKSIDFWFDNKNYQKKKPFSYFILNWNKCSMPNICWSEEKPKKYNVKKEIKLKLDKNYYIHLYGNIQEDPENLIKKYNGEKYNIPFLKSHLQKCVRRSLVNESINTAYTLLSLDKNEFFRRLPIIIVEDTKLIEEYPILIWLMICADDYKLQYEYQIQWLLKVIKKITCCDIRDLRGKEDTDIFIDKIEKINSSNNVNINLLYALFIRKMYGGMNNDMRMLSYYINLWYRRLIVDNTYELFDNNLDQTDFNTYINYEELKMDKIVFSAIDFHCYPKIIDILSDKYKEISKDDIKKTMWLLDSSYTNKKIENQLENIDEKYINIWSKIENYTQKIRSQFIKNMLNN